MAAADHIHMPYQHDLASKCGILCSCHARFEQGQEYHYTLRGRSYTKTIKKMADAWKAYRIHWIATMGGDNIGI